MTTLTLIDKTTMKIYTYYDGPCIITVRSNKGHLFLGTWCDEDLDENRIFLLVEVEDKDIRNMVENKCTLFEIYKRHRNALYLWKSDTVETGLYATYWESCLHNDYLPSRGARFKHRAKTRLRMVNGVYRIFKKTPKRNRHKDHVRKRFKGKIPHYRPRKFLSIIEQRTPAK